jgi:hypothetical protein
MVGHLSGAQCSIQPNLNLKGVIQMSQLIDNKGREHFKGMTRTQINHVVGAGCHNEKCHETRQARALAPLTEVFNMQTKFPLSQIARIKQ